MDKNNFFYRNRKEIAAMAKAQHDDIDVACIKYVKQVGENLNEKKSELDEFLAEARKYLQKSGKEYSKFLHGEID